jgi:hypothetical protein
VVVEQGLEVAGVGEGPEVEEDLPWVLHSQLAVAAGQAVGVAVGLLMALQWPPSLVVVVVEEVLVVGVVAGLWHLQQPLLSQVQAVVVVAQVVVEGVGQLLHP